MLGIKRPKLLLDINSPLGDTNSSAGVHGSNTASSIDSYSPYVHSLLDPFQGPVAIRPSTDAGPMVPRKIISNKTVTADRPDYLYVVPWYSPDQIIECWKRSNQGFFRRFPAQDILPSLDLSDDYTHMSVTCGGLTAKSATYVGGIYPPQGTLTCVTMLDPPNLSTITPESVISFAQNPLFGRAQVPIIEGIVALSPPSLLSSKIIVPDNGNIVPGGNNWKFTDTLNNGVYNTVTGWKNPAAATSITAYNTLGTSILPNNLRGKIRWAITGTVNQNVASQNRLVAVANFRSTTIDNAGNDTPQVISRFASFSTSNLTGRYNLLFEFDTLYPIESIDLQIYDPNSVSLQTVNQNEFCQAVLESYDLYNNGSQMPVTLLCVSGMSTGQQLSLEAAMRYQVVPNSALTRNVVTKGAYLSDLTELTTAQGIFDEPEKFGLRFCYTANEYGALQNSGHFATVAGAAGEVNTNAAAKFGTRLLGFIKKVAPVVGAGLGALRGNPMAGYEAAQAMVTRLPGGYGGNTASSVINSCSDRGEPATIDDNIAKLLDYQNNYSKMPTSYTRDRKETWRIGSGVNHAASHNKNGENYINFSTYVLRDYTLNYLGDDSDIVATFTYKKNHVIRLLTQDYTKLVFSKDEDAVVLRSVDRSPVRLEESYPGKYGGEILEVSHYPTINNCSGKPPKAFQVSGGKDKRKAEEELERNPPAGPSQQGPIEFEGIDMDEPDKPDVGMGEIEEEDEEVDFSTMESAETANRKSKYQTITNDKGKTVTVYSKHPFDADTLDFTMDWNEDVRRTQPSVGLVKALETARKSNWRLMDGTIVSIDALFSISYFPIVTTVDNVKIPKLGVWIYSDMPLMRGNNQMTYVESTFKSFSGSKMMIGANIANNTDVAAQLSIIREAGSVVPVNDPRKYLSLIMYTHGGTGDYKLTSETIQGNSFGAALVGAIYNMPGSCMITGAFKPDGDIDEVGEHPNKAMIAAWFTKSLCILSKEQSFSDTIETKLVQKGVYPLNMLGCVLGETRQGTYMFVQDLMSIIAMCMSVQSKNTSVVAVAKKMAQTESEKKMKEAFDRQSSLTQEVNVDGRKVIIDFSKYFKDNAFTNEFLDVLASNATPIKRANQTVPILKAMANTTSYFTTNPKVVAVKGMRYWMRKKNGKWTYGVEDAPGQTMEYGPAVMPRFADLAALVGKYFSGPSQVSRPTTGSKNVLAYEKQFGKPSFEFKAT